MKQHKAKKKTGLIIGAALIVLLLISCDMRLKTVHYTIETDKVTETVRIVLLTDLHSDKYGNNQKNLLKAVEAQNPNVVLLGGDIFDDNDSYKNAQLTLLGLTEKYLCFYVTGNHEYWGHDVANILEIVKSYGVTVLEGDCVPVEVNGQTINICGVEDPDVERYMAEYTPFMEQLERAEAGAKAAGEENFTVLLSHRPELYEAYQMFDFDLILSGHAHGGQWRIPFLLNGLYAPHQGLFPKYAGGRYDFTSGTMIVSRGLARESTPIPRIFNRPELVIIDIE